jgi:dCMP deaminase
MPQRISKDLYYLGIAESVAQRSTCLRRKYGAVAVNNDEIISTGYNGAPRGEINCSDYGYCEREEQNVPSGQRYELCRSVHGEMNAIISAPRSQMVGGTLYIVGIESKTGEYANPNPCTICRRLIKNAGFARVVGLIDGKAVELDIADKITYPIRPKEDMT